MASVRKNPLPTRNDDADAYWHHSSNFKPFNFDDDDDDEDSIDVIRWDGSTATPIKPQATPLNRIQSAPTTTNSSRDSSAATSARYQSARKNQFPPSPANLPPAASTQSVKTVKSHSVNFSQKSITEVVASNKSINVTDVAKLESEVYSLRRQLQQAKRDNAAAPSRSETLTRFLTGENYILEQYKSKEEKSALLDSALSRHDGNAIVAIVLFMRNTLKRDIFSLELMKRPIAVDHYCAYLRDAGEIDELHEILSALGRTEEAAMLKYRQCLSSTSSSSPEIRINGLRDCVKYYFDCDVRLAYDTAAILEQITMLERQSVVDDADSKAEKSGFALIFKSHPRKESLLNQSVISSLYYCCYYHWGEAEGLLSSPAAIRKQHRINDKQFHYTAIAALCRMRKWRDLEEFLTTPRSLFRAARLYSPINFEKVVDVLSKNLAPPDALEKYCSEIEGSEKRLEIGTKMKCHKVVIDTYVHLRDRQQMMAYLDKIPNSNEYLRQHLINQSRNTDIKWKN